MENRPAFTDAERDALITYETTIERGRATFIEVGRALMAIRDGRLHRLTHKTFNDYVKDRWGWSRSRAYQMMAAVRTTDEMSTTVDIDNERQARARSKAARFPLDEPPFDEEAAGERLRGKIIPFVNTWPANKRRLAPTILRAIADELDVTPPEKCELRRMDAEMESWPYTPHTVNEPLPGRGGDLNVRPGCGGAAVYHDVVGVSNGATRQDVRAAIQDMLVGKVTPLGQRALAVARGRLAGDRSLSAPLLPPHAGCVDTADCAIAS